ncbi:MAG: MarR family winged helix-turn-helix transcriptional regulator [Acidimicrobiales bacterium]
MEHDIPWLSESQQQLWRNYLATYRLIMNALEEQLRLRADLSFAEYEVLVHLSEAPGGRLRMSALANAVLVSRSGLTRRVDQMVRAGYVQKDDCTEDRRGTFAQITEQGMKRLVDAAPGHVTAVRAHFVDALTDLQQRQLAEMLDQLRDGR